jgi:hypothetical protein
MSMEVLVSVLAGIIVIVVLLLGTFVLDRWPKWSGAERRASELLAAILTAERSFQLLREGYLDIPSPSDPERIYRVPQGPGRVQVREKGQLKMWLCLQPLEWVPDADRVVIHKLMIEADEATYLQKAGQTVPLEIGPALT